MCQLLTRYFVPFHLKCISVSFSIILRGKRAVLLPVRRYLKYIFIKNKPKSKLCLYVQLTIPLNLKTATKVTLAFKKNLYNLFFKSRSNRVAYLKNTKELRIDNIHIFFAVVDKKVMVYKYCEFLYFSTLNYLIKIK